MRRSEGALALQQSGAGGESPRSSSRIWASETGGDDPKELGKQPAAKKSRIGAAGRKESPGAAWQAWRGLALGQEEAGAAPTIPAAKEGQMAGTEGSPICRDERHRGTADTLRVEKPLAAETALLVNWQQANTLITKFLDGQEKPWQASDLHSSGD